MLGSIHHRHAGDIDLEQEADLVAPSLTACDLPDANDAIFL
jgi:hypothetical protein